MTHLTQKQSEKLDALYANGQLAGITEAELESFSSECIEGLICDSEKVLPRTYRPLPKAMRSELLSLIRSGELIELSEADLKYMTVNTGSTLLWLNLSSERNREELATRTQRKRVKKLIAEGFVRGASSGRFRNLSFRTAERLIKEGERNALNGVRVKPRSQQ